MFQNVINVSFRSSVLIKVLCLLFNVSHLCKLRHRKKLIKTFSKIHFSRTAYYNFYQMMKDVFKKSRNFEFSWLYYLRFQIPIPWGSRWFCGAFPILVLGKSSDLFRPRHVTSFFYNNRRKAGNCVWVIFVAK